MGGMGNDVFVDYLNEQRGNKTKYKVVGQARYEYEVDAAEDEDTAIEKALDLFHDSIIGITYWEDILDWSAKPVSQGKKVKMKRRLLITYRDGSLVFPKLYLFIERLKASWNNRRWLSKQEFEEIERGN